jgi:RecA-family ATPase
MFNRNEERALDRIAQFAGGERELEQAMKAFRRRYDRVPTGKELVAFIHHRQREAAGEATASAAAATAG